MRARMAFGFVLLMVASPILVSSQLLDPETIREMARIKSNLMEIYSQANRGSTDWSQSWNALNSQEKRALAAGLLNGVLASLIAVRAFEYAVEVNKQIHPTSDGLESILLGDRERVITAEELEIRLDLYYLSGRNQNLSPDWAFFDILTARNMPGP